MTTDQIAEYIYTKQIPLYFTWENGKMCWLSIYLNDLITTGNRYSPSKLKFPKFCEYDNYFNHEIRLSFWYNMKRSNISIETNRIFESEKPSIEECLSDFLFWFELNKHKCKKIKYWETK